MCACIASMSACKCTSSVCVRAVARVVLFWSFEVAEEHFWSVCDFVCADLSVSLSASLFVCVVRAVFVSVSVCVVRA